MYPGSSQLHDENVGLHQGPHLLLLLRPVQQGWPSGGTTGRLRDFPEISSQKQRTFPLLLQDSCIYKVNIEQFHILLELKQILKTKVPKSDFLILQRVIVYHQREPLTIVKFHAC